MMQTHNVTTEEKQPYRTYKDRVFRMLNINYGQNESLLQKCPTLYGYSYFVATVRKKLAVMGFKEAAEAAVDECIEKGILKDFFLEQKSEVIAMSIYEYNEEYVKKVLYEDGEASGYKKGEASGYRKGEARGKAQTLVRTIESMMQNFHIELQKACEGAGSSIEEYEKAKQILEEQSN